MFRDLLLVGVGGFAGSVLRYLTAVWMSGMTSLLAFPMGTYTVNVAGSLLIGVLLAILNRDVWYFLLVVGFCGGFTTFSAFSAELFEMTRQAHYAKAVLYALGSVVVCLLATWAGFSIGTRINLIQ